MISAELRADIRRKFFGEHWKVGTIATTLGVHHETVERAIETSRFAKSRHGVRVSSLDDYKPFIEQTLESYPRLTATRVYEMVRARGFDGGIHVVRRHVRDVRPEPKTEAFFRLATLPGEQAQVDWGSFGKIRVGNTDRDLSCFVMVLSYSRAIFARFVLDMSMESFLRCHEAAFASFGGIPRTILYDNLKTVVLERIGEVIRFHPRILDFAGHYHFAPTPVGIARGNEKGRVERAIRYLRDSFFAARRYRDLEDLNRQLDRWVEEIADARPHRPDDARAVSDVFAAEERDRLLPLPQHGFPCDHVQSIRSGKTPYVRFDRNDYSIPHALVRKPLTLVASETMVRVLDGAEEVAAHERSWERHRQIESSHHLEALGKEKRRSREHRGRHRLIAACPSAKTFLEHVALHGGHLGGTTARLLKLLDEQGAKALDEAIAEATKNTSFAAGSVAFLLDRRNRVARKKPLAPVVLPEDPRVRSLVVPTRTLDAYDALGRHEEDGE